MYLRILATLATTHTRKNKKRALTILTNEKCVKADIRLMSILLAFPAANSRLS